MGKSSPSLWRATSDSRSVFVQWTLSSQLLQMWSPPESLQTLPKETKAWKLYSCWFDQKGSEIWTLGKFTHPSIREKAILAFDWQPVILVLLVGKIPLSSQILLMWSSQDSLQNLVNRNKRMEALFMLILSERYWNVNSRHVYSSLNIGKSSPSLWPATSDSCCPCWQYTLSSQILLMWSSQESLQKFAIRYKRMEALLMLIWSEMFWDMDSRQIYSSLNTGKSSPNLWPATSDSCSACWQ